MIEVDIIVEQEEKNINTDQINLIEKVIQKAAEMEQINNSEISISLVDDERITEFNSYYRGLEQPTDVLSFAMNEIDSEDVEIIFEEDSDIINTLGDIIISIPRTIKQAEEYNHSFERELAFLAVHGFLHLIGYDHSTEVEEAEMFSKQENILNNLNLIR